MIYFGTLGLLQILALPGLILIKALKIRGGLLERMIYCFPLSLSVNYLAVFLLTAAGIYIRPVVLVLMVLEIFLLMYLFRSNLRQPFSAMIQKIYAAFVSEFNPFHQMIPDNKGVRSILSFGVWIVFGCSAISAVLWGLHVWRLNFGTIFSGQDTLFSWNTFAESWAQNLIPVSHGAYPQLVPANWSLSYVLQGKDAIQLFNTLIPPVFFLLILVMLFDLGFQKRETGFFIAGLIARYMMKKLMGNQISDGYMDVPVSFMSLLAVYTLLKGIEKDKFGQFQTIFLAVGFASGAAITKQAGLMILILTPFFAAFWLKDSISSVSRKQFFLLLLIPCLMVLPWYILCWINSRVPDPASGELLADGIRRFNEQYEWSHKLFLARQSLGKYVAIFILSIIGLPLIPKRYRLPFFLCSWPLVIVWTAFFSYDARNLACALPFIALSSGMAVDGGIRWIADFTGMRKISQIAVWIPLVVLLVALLTSLWFLLPETELSEVQRLKQRELFGKELNEELLYGIIGEEHHEKDILTDYPAYFLSGYKDCCEMADFSDAPAFEWHLSKQTIRYLLIPEQIQNRSQDSALVLEACVQSGRCRLIDCSAGYYEPYCLYAVSESN